jgi:NAD(P)-dependent dehydrogenase (short-subunit alcohol dehydrogenase family)
MTRIAVITGAGSGVGRAVAVRLARAGWDIRVVGRRPEPLDETLTLAGGKGVAIPCDVADPAAVADMAKTVLSAGTPAALVNCAGTNIPNRAMTVLSVEDYNSVVDANLNGTFYTCREFLPAMKQQGGGTIVNVISDAGIYANPYSGAAYAASKFGAVGLTATINAEERQNGIRACAILPGEIDTPLLKKRPVMPSDEHRARMLQPDDVADCVLLAINLPPRAIVEQLLVRPR